LHETSQTRAISIWDRKEPNFWDEEKTAPVFNYARAWEWVDAVEEIADAFEQASERAKRRQPIKPKTTWVQGDRWVEVHPANRAGSISQVQTYCGYPTLNVERCRRMWAPGMLTRVFMASLCGLGLQWGTTASAMLVVIFTPTVGLGCRSGAYLLYGILSTVIWLMMLTSSILNHYCSINSPADPDATQQLSSRKRSCFTSVSAAAMISNLLRRTAVVIGSINTIWIVIACVFQFANFFDTCYCNSSVLGLGKRNAYNVITLDFSILNMRGVWIGSIVLGGGCIVVYALFIALMVEPPARNSNK